MNQNIFTLPLYKGYWNSIFCKTQRGGPSGFITKSITDLFLEKFCDCKTRIHSDGIVVAGRSLASKRLSVVVSNPTVRIIWTRLDIKGSSMIKAPGLVYFTSILIPHSILMHNFTFPDFYVENGLEIDIFATDRSPSVR